MSNILNKKIFNAALIGLITVFILTKSAFAISLEYKNSLSKVELSKVSDDSYIINLYTSKKFLDPVKVIKKNDLNYYILLPETKNSSSDAVSVSSDIRNITTSSYSYAGQDVKNGYTKINITTVKPLNFSVIIKDSTQNSVSQATASRLVQAPIPPAKQDKAQESDIQARQETKSTEITEGNIQKKNLQNQKKSELKSNKETLKEKASLKISKEIKKTPQKEIKKDNAKKTAIKPVLEQAVMNADGNLNGTNVTNGQEDAGFEGAFDDSDMLADNLYADQTVAESSAERIFTEIKATAVFLAKKIIRKTYKLLISSGVNIAHLAAMFVFGFVVFCAVLCILSGKQKEKQRFKNKINSYDKKIPLKSANKSNSGEYFVFDKNIKQTVLSEPSASKTKRNYELSSYDPELRNFDKTVKPKSKYDRPESEYDIIQKILREDSVINISSGEYDVMENKIGSHQPKKEREILTQQMQKEKVDAKQIDIVTSSPIEKEEMKVELPSEPLVLSKIEIAPEKGFMCVSYNDNISLVGYIFDDVFALYNFKCPKLESYEIKYRISDKDEHGTNFIVKVDRTKVVVNVAKSSMKLQVVM